MGENPCPGSGLDQDLESVCQQIRVPPSTAIFRVVMNRMVVARGHLESRKVGLSYGSGGDIVFFPDREVLEIFRFREFVVCR